MRNPFGEFQLRETIDIDRPAAVVWPYLIAFEQVPTWEGDVESVRLVTPGDPGLGTRIAADRRYGRTLATVDGEITAFEPGRSATMTVVGGPLRVSQATYSVDPIDANRSRVTFSVRASMRGPMRILHPLLPAIGRRGVRQNLVRLRRRVDAGVDPRSDARTPGRS
jgi:hypothetical protein